MPDAAPSRLARLAGPALFVALALAFAYGQRASTGPAVHGDGHYTYLWARSLAFDGDLDLANDYAICGDPWGLGRPRAPGRRPPNVWGVGAAAVWAPLLVVARVVVPADGRPAAERLGCLGARADFALLGSALAAAGAVWLAFRLARRHVGIAPAALGATAVALATPLLFYATVAPAYGHAASALAVALALERWDATRGGGPGRWPLLGALVGLAMLVRASNLLLAAVPAIELGAAVARAAPADRRRTALRAAAAGAACAAAALLVFLPQLLVWRATYGRAFLVPQGPHFMRWGAPDLAGVLVSQVGGVLAWNPVLYLAPVGLGLALWDRRTRAAGGAAALVLALATYVNAAAWDFSGSGGFPNRRFADLALPLSFGIAVAFARGLDLAARRPRAFATAAFAGIVAAAALWAQVVRLGGGYAGKEGPAPEPLKKGLAALVDGTWRAVGNPLSWPGSLPFALVHRAHPRRYDLMHGRTLFLREPETLRPIEDRLRFDDPSRALHLVEGFSPEVETVAGRPARKLPRGRGRALVPLAYADFRSVELTAAPLGAPGGRLRLVWNGADAGTIALAPGWETYRLPRPASAEIGVNELVWEAEGEGAAFGELRFSDVPPELPVLPELPDLPERPPGR